MSARRRLPTPEQAQALLAELHAAVAAEDIRLDEPPPDEDEALRRLREIQIAAAAAKRALTGRR